MVMCVSVVIRTYICTYLLILLLNSLDAFANINIYVGYLNGYILNLWHNFYLGCKQILIHAFLSYDSTGRMRILIVLQTYVGR